MRIIPIKEFGRDHWSTLAYIETRCVDHRGIPDRDHMRLNPKRHPGLPGPRQAVFGSIQWKAEYSSRLKGHTKEAPVQVPGHDDWDCAEDLDKAGLIEYGGTGVNPQFKMTPLGSSVCARLRQHKASGGSFSNFNYISSPSHETVKA